MYNIDKIDAQIINLLVDDGRISCAEISRRIGNISERSVRYRVDRMNTEKLIQVVAVVNTKLLGFSVVADVWLEVESDAIMEVARKMTQYDCVSYVACGIGEPDISVQVLARNNDDVYRFVTEVIGKTPGVRKTTTSIVPFVLKDTHQWYIPDSVCVDNIPDKT